MEEEAEVDVQPRVDAVLTGRFPANSSVAPDDFTAVDPDSGPFFAACLQFYWRERDLGRARLGHGHFLPVFFFFFPLENVLSVYFMC